MAMNPAFLREAIRLSLEKMRGNEGGPFGAVVVRDGQIVGRGWNKVTSTNDPTAHAEVVAIRDACSRLNTFSLAGCDLYTSCEPCPLCLAAAYWARLGHIYYAANGDDAAAVGFDDRNFYQELA
jgi:guanine deaminase